MRDGHKHDDAARRRPGGGHPCLTETVANDEGMGDHAWGAPPRAARDAGVKLVKLQNRDNQRYQVTQTRMLCHSKDSIIQYPCDRGAWLYSTIVLVAALAIGDRRVSRSGSTGCRSWSG